MPVRYKIDILGALREKGHTTYKLRKEKLLAEGVMQSLRDNKAVSLDNIGRICELLGCQPGDILEYVPDEAPEQDNAAPAAEEKEDE